MPDLTIPAADGFALAASEFPAAGSPAGVVLIAPATGVRRSLYRHFAAFLAERRLTSITWDWRGTGDSRPRSLRGFAASMRDWAERDLAGVIRWAEARHPDAPLLAVGHSFGGQALGLAPEAVRLRAAVTVAAQSGYFGHWPLPGRYGYALLWYAIMPALSRVAGFFPSRALRLGEDLPRGVALEWSRWCRRPEYLGDWRGHGRLRLPLYVLGFSDDPFAPAAAVAALHDRYVSASQKRRTVTPREVGLARLGHFGFFRPEAGELWREAAEFLLRWAGGTP